MKFTIPPEHNDIHEEMKLHGIVRHGHKPEVIDKKSKELRPMNDEEHKAHLEGIEELIVKKLKSEQKKFPHNKITVRSEIHNGVLVHLFEIDPVYGIVKQGTKKVALVEDENNAEVKTVQTLTVRCPKCQKIVYQWTGI